MDVQAVTREETMGGDPIANTLADRERPFAPGIRQDDGKLVAPEPGGDVRFARARADQPGRLHKRTAAEQMPVRVVDTLESVQIDEQQRQRSAAARRPFGFPAQHQVQVA